MYSHFILVLHFYVLQLLCLYFYPFHTLCWAIVYPRHLTSNVCLETCSAFVSMRPLPREGVGNFTLATTQKLRPTLGLKHLGQGHTSMPTPMERLPNSVVSSRGVSNTKAVCPLVLGARRPRLRRGLLQQCRIALRVSRNAKHWEGSKPSRGSFPPWSFLPMGIGEQPCQWFTQHLAISSPSTVFPTCGYRGGDAAID